MKQLLNRILDNLLGVLRTFTVLFLAASFCIGCSMFREKACRPHSVTIISYQKRDTPKVIRVVKSSQIAKLEEFFPQYRCLPANTNDAAAWAVGYEVYFNFHGKSVYVLSDGQRWSNDRGEFSVHGDFPVFLSTIGSKITEE